MIKLSSGRAAPLNPSTWWHNAMRVRVCNRAMRLLSAWQNTTLTSSRLMVAQQTGAKVVKLPLNAQRLPDVDLLPELITPRSRILALGQMSNVTGGCPDLARAITFAHSAGMVVMVDGAQGRCISRRCSATGYRFLCFLWSQTVWPDGYRRAVWQIRTAGSDVARWVAAK